MDLVRKLYFFAILKVADSLDENILLTIEADDE